VIGLAPGQRVAALSYRAFADFDVARADGVVPLPAELGDAPFPGEAIGCAMNAFRRSCIGAGDTVAIIGIGFLGAILTSLAARAGATVIAISRRPFALDIARTQGASAALSLESADEVILTVERTTGGGGADCVIEATGQQGPLDLASRLVRIRGRLVIAGYHQDGPRQVDMQLWNWRGIDVVNAHERDPSIAVAGIRDAIRAQLDGSLELGPLYTHRFELGRTGEALDMMRQRPDGFLKALVIP
jgi:threonine dehydrogenase-like Zn-dependent dehydrogenase